VRASTDALTLISRPTRREHGRVGFTVGKKVGRAHVRNLVKRRLRHLMRHRKDAFARRDLVLIAREPSAMIDFDALSRSLDEALRRLDENEKRGPPPGRGKRRKPKR
jgi:ribonuclease P protein component